MEGHYFLSDHDTLLFLVQMLVLLVLARGLGEIVRRRGYPPLAVEILVGVAMGPTLLGRIAPQAFHTLFPLDAPQRYMLDTVSWLGVLFLLLVNGLDVDLSIAWKQRRDSLVIAVSDVLVPFVLAATAAFAVPGQFLADPSRRLIFALFVGTTLTISALPEAVRALHDTNILRSDLGLLVLSALTINDLIGWVVFTLILGSAIGAVNLPWIGLVLAAVVAFTAVALTLGKRAVHAGLVALERQHLSQPGATLTFAVVVGLLCGTVTQLIGVHSLFGFFIAGIMLGESPAMSERTREIIEQMVYSVFVPLFFVGIGLRLDFIEHFNLPLALAFTGVGIAGRYLGAWLGTLRSDVAARDRALVAIAHTPGGLMQVVVGSLALDIGLITRTVFVTIVFGAVASSMLVGPWLTLALRMRRRMRILDFFLPQAFVMEMESRTPFDAIAELSAAAARQPGLPPEHDIRGAVAERELTQSTAIGESIAFPHARMAAARSPKVVMGISRAGIDWDAPDGRPVRFVFMILTPEEDLESQVTVLAGIARAIEQPGVRESLLRARNRNQAWVALKRELASHSLGEKQQAP